MFSVCIATYMRPEMLEKAVRSVLEQTYGDFELLIHDDSTDDATQKVMETFSDERIKYRKNPSSLGIYKNFNSLVNASTRKYIKFLNDDDVLMPNCLEFIAKNIVLFEKKYHREPLLITLAAEYIDNQGKAIKRDYRQNAGGILDYYVAKENISFLWCVDALPIRTPTHSVYLTSVTKEIGAFNESLIYDNDVELGYRLASLGGNLILDKTPCIRFQVHEEQLSHAVPFEVKVKEQVHLKEVAKSQDKAKHCPIKFRHLEGEVILRETYLAFRAKDYIEGFKGIGYWFKKTPFYGLVFFLDNNLLHTKKYLDYYEKF